jgi:hypothetical protein
MNQFLTERYDDIVKMAEKITQDSNYREIAHYVIEQFMLHDRAQELIDKDEAMKFMSGMIHRNYHSSTSPYHKLYRQKGRVFAKATITHDEPEDIYDYETDILLTAVEGVLEDMIADKQNYWYISSLFQKWLETPNYSELSRQTGIPRTSIAIAVEECKVEIRKRLKENGVDF